LECCVSGVPETWVLFMLWTALLRSRSYRSSSVNTCLICPSGSTRWLYILYCLHRLPSFVFFFLTLDSAPDWFLWYPLFLPRSCVIFREAPTFRCCYALRLLPSLVAFSPLFLFDILHTRPLYFPPPIRSRNLLFHPVFFFVLIRS